MSDKPATHSLAWLAWSSPACQSSCVGQATSLGVMGLCRWKYWLQTLILKYFKINIFLICEVDNFKINIFLNCELLKMLILKYLKINIFLNCELATWFWSTWTFSQFWWTSKSNFFLNFELLKMLIFKDSKGQIFLNFEVLEVL